MFSRFTADARRVMQRAFREARRSQHDFVGTEHLLYALLCDGQAAVPMLLRTLNCDPDAVRTRVEAMLDEHTPGVLMDRFPLSPASKRVFESAQDEAAAFQHQLIGPEHLLLGILRETECAAAQVLVGHGLTLAAVRAAVAQLPADVTSETQLQAPDASPKRALSADDLQRHVLDIVRYEADVPSPPVGETEEIEAQLRLTKVALGSFMGFVLGTWYVGPEYGVLLACGGIVVALVNRFWFSIVCGTVVPIQVINFAELRGLIRVESFNWLLVVPVAIVLSTFLSDVWRRPKPPR